MRRSNFPFPFSVITSLTIALALVLVASVPFGHALEIHHLFSSVDLDGHQHSDFDLCQWVQQHTSSSLAWGLPPIVQRSWVYSLLPVGNEEIVFSLYLNFLRSRGPPTSIFS